MQALVSRPTPPGPIFGVPLSLYREREEEEEERRDFLRRKGEGGRTNGGRIEGKLSTSEEKIERRDNANDYL